MKIIKSISFIEGREREIDETELIQQKKSLIEFGDVLKVNLGLKSNPISINKNKVKISSVCGSFIISGMQYNVLPKFVNISEEEITQQKFKVAFDDFIYFCKDLKPSMVYITQRGYYKELWSSNLIDYLARIYISSIKKAIEKYPMSWYNKKVTELPYVKGKIIIEKEMRKIGIHDGKVWCKYSSFQKDNVFNALLKWACDYFYNKAIKSSTISEVEEIMSHYINVNTNMLNYSVVKNLNLPRQYDEYEEAFNIAKDLYLNTLIGSTGGNKSIYGIILNSERCFQSFISGCCSVASRSLGYKHFAQQQKKLAESTFGIKSSFYTIPDDIVVANSRTIIIDAKYKLLSLTDGNSRKSRRKPVSQDFYQMISSCISYNTNVAIMFYPKAQNEPIIDTNWKVLNPINNKYISIFAIPVNLIADENSTRTQLIGNFKTNIDLALKKMASSNVETV